MFGGIIAIIILLFGFILYLISKSKQKEARVSVTKIYKAGGDIIEKGASKGDEVRVRSPSVVEGRKNCPNCYNEIKTSDKYCNNCGFELK